MLLLPALQAARGAAHGDQGVELVAPVDGHRLGDRTEPMGRVEVSVPPGRMGAAPEAFALVRELDLAQIVIVAALTVEQLAEKTLPRQVEGEHLEPVVGA